MLRLFTFCLSLILLPTAARAEPVDLEVINRIRDEGFHHSQVMDIAGHLTNVIGARVTGSPAMTEANEWTRDKLAEWGLENARLESYEFGRGWSWSKAAVHLLDPAPRSLSAIPQAWTPGTPGPVRGEVVHLVVDSKEELEDLDLDLAGKVVLLGEIEPVEPRDEAPFGRETEATLAEESEFRIPGQRGGSSWRKRYAQRVRFRRALDAFLADEGALAIVEISSRAHGILRVPRGGNPTDETPMRIPALTMMAEQFNRLARLVDEGRRVELEVDVEAQFHDETTLAHNTLAELPGRRRDEVVMAGAHLDSYHAGTGATDNAAGVAVVMEAVRILKELGVKPRRTIRVALWSGEEQGLLGSRAWVERHLAARPEPADPEQSDLPPSLRDREGPLKVFDEHAEISAYFNLDNGSGRIRGIYAEQNVAVVPIFRDWLAPLADLGAKTVSPNPTRGTDHMSFDAVGVPGFQFIQDMLDYMQQTHHTHVDTYDHLQREDLMQAAVIMASFLYHAAEREEPLPRKPMPRDD